MNPGVAGGVNRVEVGLGKSDEELVGGVIEGRQDDFAVLFERYRADVLRHLRRIHRHDEDAADVTQEVFLRLWHRAGQWKGDGPLLAWLLRIATNLALNHIRSVRRRREQPLQPPPAMAGEEAEDSRVPEWMIDASTLPPDEVLALAERRRLLRGLVTRLSEDGREVIRLIYDGHMNTRQAAAELGIPEGTVKSRIHHARKQIARSWRDLGIDWEED